MGKRAGSPKVVDYPTGVYNLQQLYRKADEMDKRLGRDYYQDFSQRVKDVAYKYGCSNGATACAVYAALSPNNSESNNLRDMARAVAALKGQPSGLEERWLRLRLTTYPPNKAKALRILSGEDPDEVLKGRKTNNFFHNLVDYTDRSYVTVDGHMVNAWNNYKVPLDMAGVTDKEYDMISHGVFTVASPNGLYPAQVQAVLWLAWRRINRVLYRDRNMEFEFEGIG